jgi:hypothetical protein
MRRTVAGSSVRRARSERTGARTRARLVAITYALLAVALGTNGATAATTRPDPFRAGAKADYQLGGAYRPDDDVTIVTRDRTEPSAGRFDICYVNGFQAQPNERLWWERNHPDLLLRENNKPVVDPNWNEAILDISSANKRAQLSAIIGSWVRGCAKAGYEAVEFDNLDTFTRFPKRLTKANAIDMAKRLIALTKRAGLQVGQKNALELVPAGLPFDFVVTESCAVYDECDGYLKAFGDRVIMIEYDREAFRTSCTNYPTRILLLADRDLARQGGSSHVRSYC